MRNRWFIVVAAFLFFSSTISAQASSKPSKVEMSESLVEATIQDEGTLLKNSTILIQSKDNPKKSFHAVTDASGKFKTKLKDGLYSLKGIRKNDSWYGTNEVFSVKKGKVSKSIQISKKLKSKQPKLQANGNFTGVLTDNHSGIQGNLIISRYTSDYEEEIYMVPTNKKGEFSALLPDGNYLLFTIEQERGGYTYMQYFTVEGNQVYIEGELQQEITITLPDILYKGKVADGSTSLAGAGVQLEKVINEEDYHFESIEYALTNKKGEFTLRALTDGSYAISVWHETFHAWHLMKFDVVNGDLYKEGEKITTLDITVPALNLKGKVTEGKNPITNAYVEIEGYTTEGDHVGFFTPTVDRKGNFEYRLPDGHYRIVSVDEYNRRTSVEINFEILNGKMVQDGVMKKSINISLPPVTFKGTLVDNGIAMHGGIHLEQVSEDGFTHWYYANTDENGIYSLRLTDGHYKIVSGYLYEEGSDFSLAFEFDIVSGKLYVSGQQLSMLELQVPPVSLKGLVMDGDQPLAGGGVSVSSADGNYYWNWIGADGTFSMRLADGEYKLDSIYSDDGTSSFMDQNFTIQNGQTYVDGVLVDTLELTIPPVTLTGTLSGDNQPIWAYINIMSVGEADFPLYFSGWVNEEGIFKFRLPDGHYQIYHVYLEDGTVYYPQTEFSIQDGLLYVNGEHLETLDLVVPPVTVAGVVYNGEQLVTNGYVSITSQQGNYYESWIREDGTFQFRLPDGEYQLAFIDNYVQPTYYHKPFTINNGKLLVDGQELNEWNLNLVDGNQN
ncbi:MSCRAMM family protein [Bacillus pinisoli]|uniref:MSCRAMM family protein n=1 Tax=Bacillus pinisoli TaxID=2901866 RepID=UPI001FF1D9D1|nr:carboxypeptidase-like regulatory domain-containing protein [Bacillus pinisoli]